MSYFPSQELLDSYGFIQAPEHDPGFDNYKRVIDSKNYYWITKRKVYDESISSVRLWLVGRYYSQRKMFFSGHLISEEFFMNLMRSAYICAAESHYFPTQSELSLLGFEESGDCISYNGKCWRKSLDSINEKFLRISINPKRVIVQTLRYKAEFWFHFEGYFPSKSFFESLISIFETASLARK